MNTSATIDEISARATAPTQALPRLLRGVGEHGALGLQQHLALHGPLPKVRGGARKRARARAASLIDEVERAGLLGHGGAAFPMARKMRAVAQARGRAIVLVNGVEAEPASAKDHTLLEMLPHLVLDGAIVAAEALDADEAIIAVGGADSAAARQLELALAERSYGGQDGGPRLTAASAPRHFVAGQESALINFLGGGEAKPTFTPPLPFERGLRRRPTLVNNVETLAHLALIARFGAPWFRQLGTASQPGSALVTISGPVAYPGVYEIEHGASLVSLIDAAGGLTGGARGALLGGYSGGWVGGERVRQLALSNEQLGPHRATLGAGVVLLLSEQACPVAEVARLARWLAGQSARQCGPCVFGLDALAGAVEGIAAGSAPPRVGRRIEELVSLTERRGACSHPDGATRVILSGLHAFQSDFAQHQRHGPCERCAQSAELPLPHIPVAAPRSSSFLRLTR